MIRPSVYSPAPPFAPQRRKINRILQNAVAKFAWWAAMCYVGLVAKSLLKVRAQVQSRPRQRTCGIRSTICSTPPTPLLRYRISAKSIAPCKLQSPKNCAGGLRGATGGWPHIHLLITEGGFDKSGKFIHKKIIPFKALRRTW